MDRATNGAARILVASPFLVTIFSDARDRAQIKLQSTHPKFNQLFGNAHKSKTKRVDCRHITLTLKRTNPVRDVCIATIPGAHASQTHPLSRQS